MDGLWIFVTLHLPGPKSSFSASDMRSTEPGAPFVQRGIWRGRSAKQVELQKQAKTAIVSESTSRIGFISMGEVFQSMSSYCSNARLLGNEESPYQRPNPLTPYGIRLRAKLGSRQSENRYTLGLSLI